MKREALEAGAKYEPSDSGTKYASRTTFHASKTLHAQAQRIRDCSRSAHESYGLGFLLIGLPYEDFAEERLQVLVHELNARFELLEHGFADV